MRKGLVSEGDCTKSQCVLTTEFALDLAGGSS
jgi:hypothetical protein